MANTNLSIQGDRFLINGELTYSEYPDCPHQGLLMNARFIQGIFDDKSGHERYHRFGRVFDPEKNTDDLIAALPQWYAAGLRAFTVGLQGGGPAFTIENSTIINDPFLYSGRGLDPAYAGRLDRLIKAADSLGMIVIVSFFYGAQTRFLNDDKEIENAVRTAAHFLRVHGFRNVIIEIANEYDVAEFRSHPIIAEPQGVIRLMKLAREITGLPTGCSGIGGSFSQEIAEASDVILIHGNSQSRSQLYNLIRKAKAVTPTRPIVINEDSPCIGNMRTALDMGVSWGYYNNMTKQEPPADWRILPGEDQFFALRMMEALHIPYQRPEDEFVLCGMEKDNVYQGKRFIRLSAMYPEMVDKVEFRLNGRLIDIAYEESFAVCRLTNYFLGPVTGIRSGDIMEARIYLADGQILSRSVQAE